MIVYENNKTFRNLQEQVGKNANDIEEIKQSLGNALPDPIPGPEGPEGPQGERGAEGPRGNSIKTCGYPLPDLPSSVYLEGDMALCVAIGEHLGDVYKVVNNRWLLQCNIRGPQGVPADGGSEVIANPVEAATEDLDKIKIDGVVYSIDDVIANPDYSHDHLGLETVTLNGTTYYVGGTSAKYLDPIFYEDDGEIRADETLIAAEGIMTDDIYSSSGNGITIDDGVLVDGDLRTEEDLYVVGTATIDGLTTFGDAILVDSIASATDQDTAIQTGKLAITGNSTVSGSLDVSDSITVSNDVDIGNDLTVYGTISVDSALDIVDGNGDPIIPSTTNMVTTDTNQIITGVKSFTSGMAIGSDVSMSGNLDVVGQVAGTSIKVDNNGTAKFSVDNQGNIIAAGNISVGNVVTGNGKSVQTNRIDLTGNNNTIHFQSSNYTGNSKLHDDTQNTDTAINNLMDGKRVIVHNLRLVFNTDGNNTYPTGSRLGFQINASKAGLTSVAILNNYPVGLFQGIPAWFDFNDHDKPIPGILVDANFGSTGHLKFCYYDYTLGYYTVLDLLTANISMVMDTRTAQV